ncbi:F-box protein skip5 [Asimina triloba]
MNDLRAKRLDFERSPVCCCKRKISGVGEEKMLDFDSLNGILSIAAREEFLGRKMGFLLCLPHLGHGGDFLFSHVLVNQPAVGSADRHNTALVCHRWRYLACHPRLWLRVEPCIKSPYEPGVFPDLQTAVSAARPGDTILIVAGREHVASNIQIKKPLCLFPVQIHIGGGDVPDDTILTCSRGSDSAFEFLSTCKVANLTVRAELGCCLLHRSGRLTIEGCVLQCERNPLDYLSCPIVTTAGGPGGFSSTEKGNDSSVTVSRTRIEGGAKAVITCGTLVLQRVRVICTRTALLFWFDVEHQ